MPKQPKIIKRINEMRKLVREAQCGGKVVGLVPTMGALHDGHASLIRAAASQCDAVAVSIFVNPTQFAPTEDLDKYPRTPEKDIATCAANGADWIFMPDVAEMYPDGKENVLTSVQVGALAKNLCGRNRPTHFAGVCGVVAKLFNIVPADRAYFGQKDFQQLRIIEQMAADLDFPVEIVRCRIVRESDGLAMSSRNAYLTPEQRTQAVALSGSLKLAQEMIKSGARDAGEILAAVRSHIEKNAPSGEIDYVQLVDAVSLDDVQVAADKILIALAVRFGQTRLIDNIYLELGD